MRGVLLLFDISAKTLLVYMIKRNKKVPDKEEYVHGVIPVFKKELEVSDKVTGLSMMITSYEKGQIGLKVFIIDNFEMKAFIITVKDAENVLIPVNEVSAINEGGKTETEDAARIIKKLRNTPEKSTNANLTPSFLKSNGAAKPRQPLLIRRKPSEEIVKRKKKAISVEKLPPAVELHQIFEQKEEGEMAVPPDSNTKQLLLRYAKLYEVQSAKLDSIVSLFD